MSEIRGFSPGMIRFMGKPDSGSGPSKQKVIKRAARIGRRMGVSPVTAKFGEGSSRLYMKLKQPEKITLDGKPTKIKTGVKVALRPAPELRKTYERGKREGEYDRSSVGAMQNEAENGDSYVNSRYRILTKNSDGTHSTNTEHGIFPPLMDHDKKDHEWAHVGHTEDLNDQKFGELTKTESHPNGISHYNFMQALERDHSRNNGTYFPRERAREKVLDKVEQHPLVQKFLNHQRETGTPPADYDQIENLGVFTHPHTGEKHIVARDHGFDANVEKVYNSMWRGGGRTTTGTMSNIRTTRVST